MTGFGRLRMRHHRVFLALCEHRTLTRAAETLNTVQPALSRTLREMEEVIGAPLFDRGSSGLTLTAAGETLRQFLSAGITQIEQGLRAASGSGMVTKVSVGMLPNVARTLVPATVARFKQYAPGVKVRLYRAAVRELLAMMRGGEIDFIASRMIELEDPHGLTFEHLYAEPLIFAAASGHPLAGRDALSAEDLDDYTVVVPVPGTFIRTEMDRFLFARGFPSFRNTVETISLDFIRTYLERYGGIACIPLGTVEEELETGRMTRLPVGGAGITGSVGLSFITGRALSPEAQRLVQMLRDAAAERQT